MDEKSERQEMERMTAEVLEIDELFRRADFAAEVPGLEARIWQRIQAKLEDISERELGDEELSELAAAGNPYYCGIPQKKDRL